MLILLSPAKTLDYETQLLTKEATTPRLLKHSSMLIEELRRLSPEEVGKLMSISPKLSELNYERYHNYQSKHTKDNSRQAILAFTGDVYQGMELSSWTNNDFKTAQSQIRILSGLYGVLRPLDSIQPHRLEMGTKLKNARGNNLYSFWDSRITDLLNQDIKDSGADFIVNLASDEYFSSIKPTELKGKVIKPIFKDEKDGAFKVISFYAKKARGMMADFIIRNQVESVEGLKKFKTDGYQFDAKTSDGETLVFLRSSPA